MNLRDVLSVRTGDDGDLVAEPPGRGFLFGGLTLGLALRAAAQSVAPGMCAKSCHTYFIGAGEWGVPTVFDVVEESNGKTFSVRHVRVRQEARTVAVMSASFHAPSDGSDWQVDPPGPGGPEDRDSEPVHMPVPDLIEVRSMVEPAGDRLARSGHPYWARVVGRLGEDPGLHDSAMAFISDYMVIFSMLDSGVPISEPTRLRTVNHSIWFHRPVNAEDWMLFTSDPVSVNSGRGLAQGAVHNRTGVRLATFTQEVILPR